MKTDGLKKNIFSEVIAVYTRTNAIEDGVLIDVTKTAKQAGISFPVAITNTVFYARVIPSKQAKRFGQREEGRLWDVLWMFRCAAKNNSSSALYFKVIICDDLSIDIEDKIHEVTLKAVCGPGDNLEPVVTIMEINED